VKNPVRALQACSSELMQLRVTCYHYSKKFFSVDIIWFSDYLNQLRIRGIMAENIFRPNFRYFSFGQRSVRVVLKKQNGADGKPQTPRSA